MLRHVVLIAVLGLFVATATAADQPSKMSRPKLSDDAKKFITYCNQLMEIDYGYEVFRRGHPMQKPLHETTKRLVDEQERTLRKFVRGYLIPRSRSRLAAYICRYSPSELRKLNELTTVGRRLTEAEGERFSEFTDDLIKIEDAVLDEIPKSKFPNFD